MSKTQMDSIIQYYYVETLQPTGDLGPHRASVVRWYSKQTSDDVQQYCRRITAHPGCSVTAILPIPADKTASDLYAQRKATHFTPVASEMNRLHVTNQPKSLQLPGTKAPSGARFFLMSGGHIVAEGATLYEVNSQRGAYRGSVRWYKPWEIEIMSHGQTWTAYIPTASGPRNCTVREIIIRSHKALV